MKFAVAALLALLAAQLVWEAWGDSLTFDEDIFALDSANGLDVTLIVATNYVGDATVGYTVKDGKGGVASGTITVTITDNDKPTIAAPSGGFTPLVIYAGSRWPPSATGGA